MSRRPARFTQADIRRAIAAVEKSGAQLAVEILPDGTIRLVPVPPPHAIPKKTGAFDMERRIPL